MRLASLVGLAFIGFGSLAGAQRRGEAAPAWTLVEDLRIGEAQGQTFTDVRGIAATKNGNIFVLDFKPQSIRLFDAKGNFLKQVARDGAGPGEIRNANGLAVGANDVVWVNDPSNSRFSLYRADGSFYKQVLVPIRGYGYIWSSSVDKKGRAIDMISISTSRDPSTGMMRGQSAYRRIDENSKVDTLELPACRPEKALPDPPYLAFRSARGSMMMAVPFLPTPKIALTADGRVWCTASDAYRLSTAAVGQPVKEVVNLNVAPPPVTDAERKQALDRIDSLKQAYGSLTSGDPSAVPRTKPVIAALHADPAGRAWVRLTDTPVETPSFDVFDREGNHVARVASRGKVDLIRTWLTDAYLYTVVLDADDVPTVVRYRIVR